VERKESIVRLREVGRNVDSKKQQQHLTGKSNHSMEGNHEEGTYLL
jgi:hypothetical protein